jgi:NTP pyrophosphatase (non-canonical NTP hydrolase)
MITVPDVDYHYREYDKVMIDLKKYAEFVLAVTSEQSKKAEKFYDSLMDVHMRANAPLLLTAMIGLTSEAGEAQEIVKKCLFQGKAFTPETEEHLKKELGDVIWYWINACNALDLDPNEVIAANVAKLEARYPGGQFDPFYSNNRKEGDI